MYGLDFNDECMNKKVYGPKKYNKLPLFCRLNAASWLFKLTFKCWSEVSTYLCLWVTMFIESISYAFLPKRSQPSIWSKKRPLSMKVQKVDKFVSIKLLLPFKLSTVNIQCSNTWNYNYYTKVSLSSFHWTHKNTDYIQGC